jgi:hypothetical protein
MALHRVTNHWPHAIWNNVECWRMNSSVNVDTFIDLTPLSHNYLLLLEQGAHLKLHILSITLRNCQALVSSRLRNRDTFIKRPM